MTKRLENDGRENENEGRMSPKKRCIGGRTIFHFFYFIRQCASQFSIRFTHFFLTDGDSMQMHFENTTFQQHNLPHNNNNNHSLISPGQQIYNPNMKYNFTIEQKDGSTAFAPNIVGTNITGDVNMNLHVVSV